jgi:UDPglucose 6-dehydrogenase
MNISVIGTGYVGLPVAICFAELGNSVTCIDKKKNKIKTLSHKKLTLFEKGLYELFIKNIEAKRLKFTCSLSSLKDADAIIITVDTPFNEDTNLTDLSNVYLAAKELAKNISNKYVLIIIKSTVQVGTCDNVEKIIKEINPKSDFDVVSIPEFLREGSAVHDFFHPDRIIVGLKSQRAKNVVEELYSSFKNKKIVFVSRRSSEIIKHVSNAFLALKVHFINEVADFCEKVDGNIYDVAYGIGLDKRIGNKFLKPGPGYGGNCFPKDTMALAGLGKHIKSRFSLVETCISGNENRKKKIVSKILGFVKDIKKPRVVIFGLAFKNGTDDCRHSVSVHIGLELFKRKIDLAVYDPIAMINAKRYLGDKVFYTKNEYDAAKNADIIVIATDWDCFKHIDWGRIGKVVRNKFVFDTRNIVDKQEALKHGFECYKIGC